MMNGRGKSDSAIVAGKPTNKAGQPAAESVDFGSPISVDGALTGRGGDIIIIDDPIAAMAALSQKSREHVVNWFFNTALSRLDDKQNGAIVLVMQRLHEDDLAGVLLRGSDKWTVLSLPGIAEQDERIAIGNGQVHVRHAGDALHAEREPRDVLECLRAQLGPETFAAQYQQQPMALGGATISRAAERRDAVKATQERTVSPAGMKGSFKKASGNGQRLP